MKGNGTEPSDKHFAYETGTILESVWCLSLFVINMLLVFNEQGQPLPHHLEHQADSAGGICPGGDVLCVVGVTLLTEGGSPSNQGEPASPRGAAQAPVPGCPLPARVPGPANGVYGAEGGGQEGGPPFS